jgi:hypothetical protein
VGIKEEHKELTGFTVPSGHYEFNRLPFGLSDSPASFQRLMDMVLKHLVGTECRIFLDDVIVYSKSAEEHAARLRNVLRRFDEANLQLNPEKCVFAQPPSTVFGICFVREAFRLPRIKSRQSDSTQPPKMSEMSGHSWD